ncbi:putative lysozyme-like protein-like protein [Carex littledalei]|uniref:Putative lysozyme-like protein-like protein n=1 Tax=Carex littledalei TaxID=544730 RepID=A0A833RS64_9POAL|nr:putative lysozyme-like protein-like protein [Carex littledalei]
MTFAVALTAPSFSLPSPSPSLRRSPPSLYFPSIRFSPVSLQFTTRVSSSTPDLGRRIEFEPQDPVLDTTGGDGGDGFGNGGEGSGNGGGGDGDGDGEEFKEGEGEGEEGKKKMLMSQKFTLAYAILVGAGGIMGFIKKGSMKSAAAGGLSSLLLFYVYSQLPTNPTFASSLGLGISGALLTVMGSRFKNSGKIMPAGIVSLVSLFMTGGYLHAILRGH